MKSIGKNRKVLRMTKIRKAIIKVLTDRNCLCSKTELVKNLTSLKIYPDRSTVYREMKSLEKSSLVRNYSILGKEFFELSSDHHHHLICLNCRKVDRVDMGSHLEEQEKIISGQKGFNTLHHNLEFYGYCQKCSG